MAIPPLVIRIIADSSGVKAGTAKAAAEVNGLRGTITKNAGLIQGALVGAVVAFAASSVKAAAEAAAVFAQTEAVIKSTGGAAGVTAEEMRDLAASFQETTTFADEAVLGAENLLLTFTKIGGETLPDATQAVLDMSQALGQDLKSSAIQVGKALQNPEVGLTALRRVGISFTDSQVELIKQLDATGRSAEAQAIIIDELTREFGGSAAAAADTFAGRMAKLGNEINDIQEEIGRQLIPVLEEILPVVGDLAKVIGGVLVEGMRDALETVRPLTDLFGALGDEMAKLGGSSDEAGDSLGGKLLTSIRDQISPTLGLAGAYGEWRGSVDELEAALAAMNAEVAATTFQDARAALGVIEGLWNDYVDQVDGATEAEKRHAAALGLSISAMREAAGGLLGLIEASRTYAEAQKRVNRLEENGKKGTKEYRDAVADLLTQRLELSGALDELRTKWKEQGISLADAKAALQKVGTQAGLEGAALRRFIQNGLKPVRSELGKLKAGSPYTFEVRAVANFSQLTSKLRGLEARYNLELPTRAAGGPVSMGRPYVVGENGPELFVPSSGGTVVANGGSSRTRREAAYLDRVRWERDHAYSREYEGWR